MDVKHAYTTTMSPSYPNSQLPEYVADTSIPNIPQAFKASFGSSWSKILCASSKTIHLTPSKSSTSSFPVDVKISLPNGYYGSLILEHANKSSHPLARAFPEGRRRYDVLLPGTSVAETLRREPRKSKWWFALPIGPNGELETFEWRRSRGSEVKQLNASWRGWKLVRKGRTSSHDHQAAVDQFSKQDDDSLPRYSIDDEKSDSGSAMEDTAGEEIVAVWAKSGTWTSLHDIGEFAFHGSGASGELGQRFAIMAVMTALSIWQKAMRDAETAGAASAATSSSASVAAAVA